ncbi:putative ribonuclease H-like domain-containing protein [Tanacetum coccineum]
MEAGTTTTTLTARLPILNPGDYDLWLMRIEQYFLMTDYSLWEVIKNGNKVLKKTVRETEQEYEPTTAEEKQDRRNEMKARGTLLMALPNKDQLKFHSFKDAKLLMEAIEKRYGGNKESKKVQRTLLKQKYENFLGSSSEIMDQIFDRSLPSEWKTHALIWRNKEEIETINLDDLYKNLMIYEHELAGSSSTSQNPQNVAFVSSNSTNSNYNNNTNEADNTAYGVSATHTQCNPTSRDNLKQIDPDDLEEIDLQWEMAMLTIRARRFIQRTGRKLDVNGQRVGFDRTKVECYNCHKNGHFAREYRAPRNQENRGKENSRRTMLVETPTKNALVTQDGIGSFSCSRKLCEFMQDGLENHENMDVITIVTPSNGKKVESNHESAGVKNNDDAVEPKTVRKNSFRPPVIEDWNSNDKSKIEIIPKDKTVSSSTEKIKFVKSSKETVEKGNPQQKEYKEKGVIDSGCSRHMIGNKCYLTEYEVYDGGFVSFGDGKVRISGKVPRKDNIYSVNLKSVVPTGGLTCLFAKREFSVARTLQQNGVAERKNRTLIEAARTMLVNSKLPTTFWTEAVNTACYVLNRFLIIKPHNKTPYELIRGRPLLIDFMKPFRYFVVSKALRVFNKRTRIVKETINIKFLENAPNVKGNGPDWLFDVDSLTISMNYVPVVAGNQTNGIAGNRDNIVAGQTKKKIEPEQEYILIPLCITDPSIAQDPKDREVNAGKKDIEMDESRVSDNDGKDEQATRSESERIIQKEMQNEHINSTNSINTVSTHVSTDGPSFANATPSSSINDVGTPDSTANAFEEHLFERFSPFKNASTLPHVLNVSPMHDIGIFGNAYDDEDVEEEVDMNNVVSSYTVPDAPFTKFLKDHPKDQVIGSLKTPVQTRHMTNINDEHGLISSVHKLRRTNHKDFQNFWTFVDLPRDKWAIGTKLVFINKKDERGIVVKNKAILVAQGHTQEEGVDYDEVFALVARIEAIRLFLAYASFKDFVVYQVDVKSAFLYGKIEEEVYVCQPFSFEDPDFPDKVYKVEKALYGLHQAPRAWYETLSTYLLDNVKTASTPMKPNKSLIKDEEAEDVDVYLYISMIGSLMYLTASRPDITFAVCSCARFQVTPKTSHLHAVKRIFRYLKGQPKLGLWYPKDSPFDLEAFSDSDYAGASLDRKSTIGGVMDPKSNA